MTQLRFIHTADLHLDAPFRSLSNVNEELARKVKDASLQAFRRIIDKCIEEKVDFLVIAGDIFDGEDRSLTAQLTFRDELARLAGAGIPAYFNCGNHDPLSSWMEQLSLPERVHRFGSDAVERFTFEKGGQPLADIYGISFEEKVVTQNLARQFERQESEAPFSLAVLHGTIGHAGPHERYAPFTKEDVADKGFDYWALGHIHQSQVIREQNPAIVYPGIPQGRDMGESGEKGCYLVELQTDHAPELTFIPTGSYRFEHLEVDITGIEAIDQVPELIGRATEQLPGYDPEASYILRVTLTGRTALHRKLQNKDSQAELLEYCNRGHLEQTHFTWLDRLHIRTQPDIDLHEVAGSETFAADLLEAFDALGKDNEQQQELIDQLAEQFASYPVRKEIDMELTEEERQQILEAAKWKLMDQLLKTG